MTKLYEPYRGTGKQYQRKATPFEQLLDVLQMPTQGLAGAVDATLSGQNPLEGAANYIKNDRDFTNIFLNSGMDDSLAAGLGLATNMVADPLNYVGVGLLTKSGRAARAAKLAFDTAEEAGDLNAAYKAAKVIAKEGVFSTKLSEQAAAGHRNLLEFAGRKVVGGQRVLKELERVQDFVGESQAGKVIGTVFGKINSRLPEYVKLRKIQMATRAGKKLQDFEKEVVGASQQYYDEMLAAGVDADTARNILLDATERWRPAPNVSPEDHIAETINQVLQKYGWDSQLDKISPKLQRAVSFINASNAGFLASEQNSGLMVSNLIGDLNYLKRILTPEGRDALIAAQGSEASKMNSAYDVSVRFASQIERDEALRHLTVNQINEMSEMGLLALTGNKKVKLFEDEPFFATFKRGSESFKATEAASMVNDFANKYGHEVLGTVENPVQYREGAPIGHAFLHERLAEDLGLRRYENGRIVRDVALPKDIVEMLQSHYERVLAPAGLQPLLRGYDSLTRIWKNLTLPIWPAYQTRNTLSDLAIITHGADEYGLSIPSAIKAISDTGRGMVGRLDTVDIGNDTRITWEQFTEMLHTHGVLDYNPGRDIDDFVLNPKGLKNFRKGLAGLEERMNKMQPFDAAVRVSMFRQNSTNAGYFLGLLRKGVSPEVAALEVKKRLFDFGDLTDFEKQVFRRVAPFYSWLRHNIPYQISAAVRRPRIVSELGWVRNAMTGGEGPAGDVALPGWLAEGVPMGLGRTGQPGHPNFMRLKGLLPQADVAAVANPVQEVVNAVSPILKTPVEMATNYSFFKNQPLERYPGEAGSVLGINMSRRWAEPVVDQLRPASEIHNMFFRDQSLGAKLGGFGLTKGYSIDKSLQTRLMYFKLEQERTRVKKLIYQAAQKGDSGEILTLRRYLKNLENNPRQLLK